MKNISIVLGCLFGDEGKGLVTNSLSGNGNTPLVIRFSGGHQAGHTVYHDGIKHVFKHFGSGTLNNIHTYWSKYCTFHPQRFVKEYKQLIDLGLNARIIIDSLSPVTTPYDEIYNRYISTKAKKNGSCNVGFGATLDRTENHYCLYFQDLLYKNVWKEKLKNIKKYYDKKIGGLTIEEKIIINDLLHVELQKFEEAITFIFDNKCIQSNKINFNIYDHLIFEGSQGILLDRDFGFHPNITRSSTTSRNAFEIIKDNNFRCAFPPEIYYVIRAYQTRHGNGYMTNENISAKLELINNENETNIDNINQGEFRKTILDFDLVQYAIQCDDNFSHGCKKNLIMTCVDQIENEFSYTKNNEYKIGKCIDIQSCASFDKIYFNSSKEGNFLPL